MVLMMIEVDNEAKNTVGGINMMGRRTVRMSHLRRSFMICSRQKSLKTFGYGLAVLG